MSQDFFTIFFIEKWNFLSDLCHQYGTKGDLKKEEAGREVEKARLDGMDDADFMLDEGDSSMNNEVNDEVEGGKISKKKKKSNVEE